MKKKVYISGPITGHYADSVRNKFKSAELYLEASGFEPVNPMDNGVPVDATWSDHMRADIKLLMDCDAIFMLEGWMESTGALLEHHVAVALDIEVMHADIASR